MQWSEGIERDFAEQLLGLDTVTFKAWAILYAEQEARGFNMDVMDSLISATAVIHHLVVVTRNTTDFPPNVKTLNPWLVP
jgi:predicted nucleic acid-binding protein